MSTLITQKFGVSLLVSAEFWFVLSLVFTFGIICMVTTWLPLPLQSFWCLCLLLREILLLHFLWRKDLCFLLWLLSCLTDSRDSPQSVQINCSFSCIAFLWLFKVSKDFRIWLQILHMTVGFSFWFASATILILLTAPLLLSDYFGNMYSEINHSLPYSHF